MAIGEAEAAALGATDAVAMLGSGELGLEEYVEALMRRTERLAHLGAYVTFDADAVLAAAARPDASRGPLHGLPVGIKDAIGTADMPTGAGTPGLDGWTPPVDAEVVGSLRAAGATITGKLALHELSSGVTSNNAHTGPVSNPYRLDHHTGGSSGGTAAAVTAGLVPVGLGGDTAARAASPPRCVAASASGRRSGAARRPAACRSPSTRDTPGPLGRRWPTCGCSTPPSRATSPRAEIAGGPAHRRAARSRSTSASSRRWRRSRRRRSTSSPPHGAVLVEVDMSALPEVNRAVRDADPGV